MHVDPRWCRDSGPKQVESKNREVQLGRDARRTFCAFRFEFCIPSDLGEVVFGDSSLGVSEAGGDGSSSRS